MYVLKFEEVCMSYRQYTSINAFPMTSWKTLFCLFAIFSNFFILLFQNIHITFKSFIKRLPGHPS